MVPDLNPIENLWSRMKSWMERRYDVQQVTEGEFPDITEEAWEAIPETFWESLYESGD